MMREFPIFGIGLNSFEENMSAYDRTGITNVIQQPVHNVFCLVGAETGIPSLLVLLALWGGLTMRSFRLLHDVREHAFVAGAVGLCACLGLGLASMFDIPLRKEPILGLCALIAGMVMAFDGESVAPPKAP
jgi:O-antigen ligase